MILKVTGHVCQMQEAELFIVTNQWKRVILKLIVISRCERGMNDTIGTFICLSSKPLKLINFCNNVFGLLGSSIYTLQMFQVTLIS